MKLLYNIDYEVAAAAFLLLMYIYLRVQYSNSLGGNSRMFRKMILVTLAACLMDIVTAISFSNYDTIPSSVNNLLNFSYLIIQGASTAVFALYAASLIRDPKVQSRAYVRNAFIYCSYVLLLLLNFPLKYIYDFVDGIGYVHGPFYLLIFGVPMLYTIDVMILLGIHRGDFNIKQILSLISFLILELSASGVQLIWLPHVLLPYFAGAMGGLIILIALETPDYKTLENTMEELRTARAEAQKANEAKSTFLANMSHEIRTPINGILGMNTIILQSEISEDVRECAENIDSAGRSLLGLINDILDLSRIEAGKMEIHKNPYRLSSVLNDSYLLIRPHANEKNLTLRIDADPTIPDQLIGDELRIRQIMNNLLNNAVKYTKTGLVLCKVTWEDKGESEMQLLISVKDTGIGIPKEHLEHLFDAFSRAEEDKHYEIEGTGLGLGITKRLLDAMEGSIRVDSIYGSGSLFSVTIPQEIISREPMGNLAQRIRSSSERAVKQKQNYPNLEGRRILIVDDVVLNQKVLVGLLKKTGVSIDLASGGADTLEMVQQKDYDLILLDHMMPEMDGVETLRRMKLLPGNRNESTPIVMLTANAIVGAREEYLAEGFDDYLSKPIREDLLMETLRKYLT